jgi:hypothetical protein
LVAKKGKRSTKKVKSLKAKSLSAERAKRVRGGLTFGVSEQYKPTTLPQSGSKKIQYDL